MTGGTAADLPPIRHNDYSPLDPPALGAWDPELSVSVIIPARGGQHRLDLTLASLAAQTYPDHLMEVIVVDDGSESPLRLPEIVPRSTRIVTTGTSGWGIAHAVNTGAALADGRIIQRLDADMVVCREHIEALARWHHLAGYLVTIGAKRFIEEPSLTAAQVHDGVLAGRLESVFDLASALPSSTEQTISRTNGLRASRNPYHVCTGPTVSMRREIFRAVDGVDTEVLRGEDTEFAYRLAAHGVVFIPDMTAQAVHLGLPAQRRNRQRAVQIVAPYLAHRVPLRRDLRKDRGRHWLVPYVEVVLHVDEPGGQVREAVGAALDGSLGDVVVTLVAPWSKLSADRRPVLDDPLFDLRLLREHFAHDERVRFADEVSGTPAPIPFRYTGPVSVPLGHDSLERMIGAMQDDRSGMLVVDLGGDGEATLERTEALGRARLLGADDVAAVAASIMTTHGVRRGDRPEFWPVETAPTASTAAQAAASAQERVPAPAPERESAPPAAGQVQRRQVQGGLVSLLGRLRTVLRS
ncbi:glycosyltransferase family 2 protein [Streptosporangium sp. NBC_01755]|uniref:glycosyltransferase n=1 Tax=unclassified Streptosporangium TaxID=2632669 RepID=UPI002DDBA00A|nr:MULTISPECIES: glycosyltransferase family 2 protein [unclassified Streptosporangium]WSA23931.1 glycosyltransferase family 2 protein [Streptosporangium sp. NBC_01810]WSC97994.1 glycosyltransferase family 2 protein [Streptosporangium sp. NBC_01755]